MFRCPAIAQVERDTIGQRDARLGRVARSLGLEVCGFMTLDRFFNRKYSPLMAYLCGAVSNRVPHVPRTRGPEGTSWTCSTEGGTTW